MIVDLVGCARCEGDGHKALEFKSFTIPVEDYWTHWAMCPTVDEPILYVSLKIAPR